MIDQSERKRGIRRVLVITLVLNVLVAIIKIIAGKSFNFLSLTSSGLESLVDGSTNVLALIAIYFASIPADDDHHYGHYKAETLGSLVVALLLLFSAYEVATQINIGMIFQGEIQTKPHFGIVPVLSILFSMGVSLFVSWYEKKWARVYKSKLLEADSSHTFGDFLLSIAVLISIIFSYFEMYWVDIIVGCGVTAYLVFLALKIVKMNINDLLDGAPDIDEGFLREIEKMDHVEDIHNFRIRGNEHWLQVDFHVHLSPELSFMKAHEVGKLVEQRVIEHLKKYAQIVDVLVHIEPK